MDKDELIKLSGGQLNSNNVAYVEALYEDYLSDPASVPEYWRELFSKLSPTSSTNISHANVRTSLREQAKNKSHEPVPTITDANNRKQVGVIRLISAYRYLGHRQADIDPLGADARPDIPELNPEFHGLTHSDMETVFETGSLGARNSFRRNWGRNRPCPYPCRSSGSTRSGSAGPRCTASPPGDRPPPNRSCPARRRGCPASTSPAPC